MRGEPFPFPLSGCPSAAVTGLDFESSSFACFAMLVTSASWVVGCADVLDSSSAVADCVAVNGAFMSVSSTSSGHARQCSGLVLHV